MRRTLAMMSPWSRGVPCDGFSRATFMPARIERLMRAEELLAGPIVQTILVHLANTSCCRMAMAAP